MPLRLLPVVAYCTGLEFGLHMLGKELLQNSCQGAGAFFFPQGRGRIFAQRDLGEPFPGQRPGLIRSDGREGPQGKTALGGGASLAGTIHKIEGLLPGDADAHQEARQQIIPYLISLACDSQSFNRSFCQLHRQPPCLLILSRSPADFLLGVPPGFHKNGNSMESWLTQ